MVLLNHVPVANVVVLNHVPVAKVVLLNHVLVAKMVVQCDINTKVIGSPQRDNNYIIM